MDISLPESGTNQSNREEWKTVSYDSSATQREKIDTLSAYSSILSKKLKEVAEKVRELDSLKGELSKIKDDGQRQLEKTKNTESLIYFGFFALFFVVIGIAYGYWQFIYDSSKNEDYRYNLSEKIIKQENELIFFKKCLKSGSWNSCF